MPPSSGDAARSSETFVSYRIITGHHNKEDHDMDLNLCYYIRVRDQVSHPYKTTGKIMVLYILIFTFLYRRREAKYSELTGSKCSLYLIWS